MEHDDDDDALYLYLWGVVSVFLCVTMQFMQFKVIGTIPESGKDTVEVTTAAAATPVSRTLSRHRNRDTFQAICFCCGVLCVATWHCWCAF